MGLISADMKRVVEEQRLGFVATVCPDGTPNLSPKGTTAVWDEDHLVFANVRSPGTIANLRRNASIEVNVVDPFVRKGYRFKGVATVLDSGPLYERIIAFFRARGSTSVILEVVLVRVQSAQGIDSPAYDLGLTEAEVRSRWERHFDALRAGAASGVADVAPDPRPRASGKRVEETERVIVTEWRLPPGGETGQHRHAHDYVVVCLSAGRLLAETSTGTVETRLEIGQSYARPAGVEHNILNPGAAEFSFVEVELK